MGFLDEQQGSNSPSQPAPQAKKATGGISELLRALAINPGAAIGEKVNEAIPEEVKELNPTVSPAAYLGAKAVDAIPAPIKEAAAEVYGAAGLGAAIDQSDELDRGIESVGAEAMHRVVDAVSNKPKTSNDIPLTDIVTGKRERTFAGEYEAAGMDPKLAEWLGFGTKVIANPLTWVLPGGVKAANTLADKALAKIPITPYSDDAAKVSFEMLTPEQKLDTDYQVILDQLRLKASEAQAKVNRADPDAIVKRLQELEQSESTKHLELMGGKGTADPLREQVYNTAKAEYETALKVYQEAAEEVKAISNQMFDVRVEQVNRVALDYLNNKVINRPEALSIMRKQIGRAGQFGAVAERELDTMSHRKDQLLADFHNTIDPVKGDVGKTFKKFTREQRFKFMMAKEGRIDPFEDEVVGLAYKLVNENDAKSIQAATGAGLTTTSRKTGENGLFIAEPNYLPQKAIDIDRLVKHGFLNNGALTKEAQDALDYQVLIGTYKNDAHAKAVLYGYASAVKGHVPGLNLQLNKDTEAFAQWLVSRRPGTTKEQALKTFESYLDEIQTPKYGNVEFARDYGLPFYKTELDEVYTQHYEALANRVASAEIFGPNGEIADYLITKIAEEAGNHVAGRVREQMALILGATRPNDLLREPLQKARAFQAASSLSYAVFMQSSQWVNTAAKFGVRKVLTGLLDALTPGGQKQIMKLGGIFNDSTNALYGIEGKHWTAKAASGVFKGTGFTMMDRVLRNMAGHAGIRTANELASTLISAEGKTVGAVKAAEALKEMGLDPRRILTKGGLDTHDIEIVAKDAINKTQFRNRPQDSPYFAAMHPLGKAVMQFHHFIAQQHVFIREELLKKAKDGDIAPILRYLAIAPPVGQLTHKLKRKAQGKDERLYGGSHFEELLKGAADMGAFSMAYDVLNGMMYKKEGWLLNLVPLAGTVSEGGYAIGKMAEPTYNEKWLHKEDHRLLNLKPFQKFAVKRLPLAGAWINEKFLKEEDTLKRQISSKMSSNLRKGRSNEDLKAFAREKGLNPETMEYYSRAGIRKQTNEQNKKSINSSWLDKLGLGNE